MSFGPMMLAFIADSGMLDRLSIRNERTDFPWAAENPGGAGFGKS
jgi:hypothetical protein